MPMRSGLLLAALLAIAACGGDEPRTPAPTAPPTAARPVPAPAAVPKPTASRPDVKVVAIEVGSALTPEKTIAKPATSFAATDTVYVVVRTEGKTEFSRISAHWKDPEGSVALMARQNLREGGPNVTEFHYSNQRGLAKGTWTVEVQLDDVPSGTRTFEIR